MPAQLLNFRRTTAHHKKGSLPCLDLLSCLLSDFDIFSRQHKFHVTPVLSNKKELKCVVRRPLLLSVTIDSHVQYKFFNCTISPYYVVLYCTVHFGRLQNNTMYCRRVKNILSEPSQKVSQIFERNGLQEITRENKISLY